MKTQIQLLSRRFKSRQVLVLISLSSLTAFGAGCQSEPGAPVAADSAAGSAQTTQIQSDQSVDKHMSFTDRIMELLSRARAKDKERQDREKDRENEREHEKQKGNHDKDDDDKDHHHSAGCGHNVSPSPTPSVVPSPVAVADCSIDQFQQPAVTITQSLDILFVTDTSGSMVQEKSQIADGIDAFVRELPKDVDYQIAVMPAHGSRSPYMGRLWQYASVGPVLSSKKQSITQIRSNLKFLMTHQPVDRFSDGGEEGLYSLTNALDTGHLTEARAKGFFRKTAALAVIFVADENDICAVYPAGIKPVADPDGYEVPAKKRDCAAISPTSLLSKLRVLQGTQPLVVGGILYNNLKTIPHSGENELGYGYLDVINYAKGPVVDLASTNYVPGLAQIGAITSQKLTLNHEFVLTKILKDIDVASIKIKVDGQLVSGEYSATKNLVRVENAGAAGSKVEVQYCEKIPAVTPSPVPSPTATPTPTPSPVPTVTPSPTVTVTPDPTPTPSPTVTVTPDPTPTPSPTVTVTPDPTPTPSPTVTVTPDPTPTPTVTPEPTPDPTPSPTPTPTETPVPIDQVPICTGPICEGSGGAIGI